ncbi:Protein SIC1 [Nakaseomyces bracarensis]|uniref:Protein SIC1 n=1 Tax=Nakaseomyces bracarensis TaxID=273131 RepID=A0ABR4NLJ6_9SACH
MTPSTPPRSRQRRSESVLDTPKGAQQLGAPVTPSTVQKFKNVPSLQQPFSTPFNGLKSPERSPFPLGSARRGSVKRSLFPREEEEEEEEQGHEERPVARSLFGAHSLLPAESTKPVQPLLQVPKLHIDLTSSLEGSAQEEEEEDVEAQIRKYAKNVPGTPSDKVITYEMAQRWNNVSSKEGTTISDTEEDTVKPAALKNPFMDDTVLTKEERRARHQKLLSENPELESSITYVNKHGQVVKQRQLSREDQSRYKPKALFTDED